MKSRFSPGKERATRNRLALTVRSNSSLSHGKTSLAALRKKKLQIPCPAHAPLPDMNTVNQLRTFSKNTQSKVAAELSRTGGLLRLAPAWVPRSFLQPGLRIKLHP